jgi:two-component system sensor histidine kinase KdpD
MSPAGRGRLKLYMGYAAGVGKTYRMLEEAQELRQWFDDMDGFTTGRAQSL